MNDHKEQRTDIYQGVHQRAYHTVQERLMKANISDHNKELILAFQNHLFATVNGNGLRRATKLNGNLRMLTLRMRHQLGIPRNLDELTYDDIVAIVSDINRDTRWAPATKSDYRRCLKQFFRWFEDRDERLLSNDFRTREQAKRLYRFLEKQVRTCYKEKQIDPAGIITHEDLKLLLEKGCANVKQRAFVAMLHATGCRAGEFLNIRLRDLELGHSSALVHVDGKTGRRSVPIVEGLSHLVAWLNNHPRKNEPDSPLWLSLCHGNYGEQQYYAGAKQMLYRIFKVAGLNKKCNMHWFRHSRASLWAVEYSEQVLCKLMGWSMGSKQVRRYVHLKSNDVVSAVLKRHGLLAQDDGEPTRVCRCGTPNDRSSKYCFRCGCALDAATQLHEQELVREAATILPKILSDPVLRERYEAEVQRLKAEAYEQ